MYRWFWLWSRELWDCWLVGLWVPTWQSDLLLSKDIHLNAIISLPFDLWLWEQIVRAHYRFLPPTGQNHSQTKNPHTHTDLLILVVWQRFPSLPLCCLCCRIESKPIAQSREGSSQHSISWSGNGQSQSTSDQNSWRKNQAIQAVTAKVQSKAKQIVVTKCAVACRPCEYMYIQYVETT